MKPKATLSAATKSKKRRSLWILLIQLIAGLLIMMSMGIYVWFIQLTYDVTLEAAKTTKSVISIGKAAALYALIVATAGFAYDSAKSIIFLPEEKFRLFFSHSRSALGYIGLVIACMIFATYLLGIDDPMARFVGQISYLAGLVITKFAVESVSGALEIASRS